MIKNSIKKEDPLSALEYLGSFHLHKWIIYTQHYNNMIITLLQAKKNHVFKLYVYNKSVEGGKTII